jgi:hypothetical protein
MLTAPPGLFDDAAGGCQRATLRFTPRIVVAAELVLAGVAVVRRAPSGGPYWSELIYEPAAVPGPAPRVRPLCGR